MVWRIQRDGLGSACQAPKNRTGDTDIPAVGQRGVTQGPGLGVSLPVRSGVGMCDALTCVPAEGAWVVRLTALSNRPQLLTSERGEWVWLKFDSFTTPRPLWGPRDKGNCSFVEVLGTTDREASGGKKRNKGFSARPSSGGGSGVFTICWAKFSTASPKRPVWDTGAFRNRALSASFMSARHSQRWRSWTTMVDIARPRDRAVTFVARSARSVAVRSSLRTPGSWPPSCRSLSTLASWTCNNAIACRAEAASPQAA